MIWPANVNRSTMAAQRLSEIRDNLTARIREAEHEGWLGEAEGLRVSLAAARNWSSSTS
jgi:hypothetical protein